MSDIGTGAPERNTKPEKLAVLHREAADTGTVLNPDIARFPSLNPARDGALQCASVGLRVIPLPQNAKFPPPPDWPNLATTNEMAIRGWFDAEPNANYGIVMGDGLIAADLDVKKVDGIAEWERLCDEHGAPRTSPLMGETTTGGRHLIFKSPGGLSVKVGIAPGIDVRSGNGYIVGAGSMIDGKRYKWSAGGDEIELGFLPELPDAPAWFVEKCSARETAAVTEPVDFVEDSDIDVARARQYLAKQPVWGEGDEYEGDDFAAACMVLDFGVSKERGIELAVERGAEEEWARAKFNNAGGYGDNKATPGSKSFAVLFPSAADALTAGQITIEQALKVEGRVYVGVTDYGRTEEQALVETLGRMRQERGGTRFDGFAANCGPEPDDSAASDAATGYRVELMSGADVDPELINWLWRGHYARGKFHVLAGKPEAGKNLITISIAAILSVGGKWPDGTQAPIGDTLIWSGEDAFKDTTLPRFIAAGGDRRRFHTIKAVVSEDGEILPFDPSRDVPALCAAIRNLPDLRYLIIDPVAVVVAGGKGASNNNAETRRALQPLVDLAEELEIVVEGITHFAKDSGRRDVLERVIESTAVTAVARIVHVVHRFEDDDIPRRWMRIKGNIVKRGGVIGYEYEPVEADVPGYIMRAPRLNWLGELRGSAAALMTADDEEPNKLDAAKLWLIGCLREAGANGVETKDLRAEAEARCHAWKTVQRAMTALGDVVKPKQNLGAKAAGWRWVLVETTPKPEPADIPL